jgi:hypothetical protein
MYQVLEKVVRALLDHFWTGWVFSYLYYDLF